MHKKKKQFFFKKKKQIDTTGKLQLNIVAAIACFDWVCFCRICLRAAIRSPVFRLLKYIVHTRLSQTCSTTGQQDSIFIPRL